MVVKFIQGKLAFILGSLAPGKTDKQMGAHQATVTLWLALYETQMPPFIPAGVITANWEVIGL